MDIEHNKEFDFSECLQSAICTKCGEIIKWEPVFEKEGTKYYYRCCDTGFVMKPKTVLLEIHEDQI